MYFLTGPAQKSSKYGTGPTQGQNVGKELLQNAEEVVDELNNHKQDMVVRSVFKMKERARSCVAVGGGVFEGRKV